MVGCSEGRRRKRRVILDESVRLALEKAFLDNPMPGTKEVEFLSILPYVDVCMQLTLPGRQCFYTMGYLCLTLNTLNVVNITLGDLALLPPWAGEDSCESQSLWCRGERYTSRADFFLIFFH